MAGKGGNNAGSLIIRSRIDERTRDVKKELFINTLGKVHNVRVACHILGISYVQVYQWRKDDKNFADEWDNAIEYSKEALESAAYLKLARSYNDGRRRISMPEAKLTEFLLTGMFPDKYRQRVDYTTTLEVTIEWAKIPDEIIEKYLAKELTLTDVYQYQIQQTSRDDSTGTSTERDSTERVPEASSVESED